MVHHGGPALGAGHQVARRVVRQRPREDVPASPGNWKERTLSSDQLRGRSLHRSITADDHGIAPADREDIGLQAVFKSVFPIKDFNGTSELVFVSYNLEAPKYDEDECRQRGMTYAAPTFSMVPFTWTVRRVRRMTRSSKPESIG